MNKLIPAKLDNSEKMNKFLETNFKTWIKNKQKIMYIDLQQANTSNY